MERSHEPGEFYLVHGVGPHPKPWPAISGTSANSPPGRTNERGPHGNATPTNRAETVAPNPRGTGLHFGTRGKPARRNRNRRAPVLRGVFSSVAVSHASPTV